jgi:hypothetical protein
MFSDNSPPYNDLKEGGAFPSLTHQAVLWKTWTPKPSVGLAFCFFIVGETLLAIALWAIAHISFKRIAIFTDVWPIVATVLLFAGTQYYLWCLIRREALLLSPSSVKVVEWIWSEPHPLWRVVRQDGQFFSFSAWHSDSYLGYQGACLMYPKEMNCRQKWLNYSYQSRWIVLPSQLGRVEYRLLCKFILSQPHRLKKGTR